MKDREPKNRPVNQRNEPYLYLSIESAKLRIQVLRGEIDSLEGREMYEGIYDRTMTRWKKLPDWQWEKDPKMLDVILAQEKELKEANKGPEQWQ